MYDHLMEKIEYAVAILTLCIIAAVIAFAIYIFILPGFGVTLSPIADIRFDENVYGKTLSCESFKELSIFEAANCGKIDAIGYNEYGPHELLQSDQVSVTYRKESRYVHIFFYAKNSDDAVQTIEKFTLLLRSSNLYRRGYEVCGLPLKSDDIDVCKKINN